MFLQTPEGEPPRTDLSRRAALGSMFTLGYALAVSPARADPIQTDPEGLVIEEPSFAGAGGYQLPAYVARPAKAGRLPAVIVGNEIFGIHAYIKDVCRRLAKQGYVAIAPDYFDRAGDPSIVPMEEARAISRAAGYAQVQADTAGALTFLQAQSFVDAKRLAITGFCWGGNLVWMSCAAFGQLKAGVAWYGRLAKPADAAGADAARPWPTEVAGTLKAPVLGLYGGQDKGIPIADVEAMRAALAATHNPTGSELQIYPQAQHGFHADYRPSYDETAAKDGWARMLAWFRAHGV